MPALLYPEGVLLLNESAGAVLELCDGTRGRADIVTELAETYEGVTAEDVHSVIDEMAARRLLRCAPPSRQRAGRRAGVRPSDNEASAAAPFAAEPSAAASRAAAPSDEDPPAGAPFADVSAAGAPSDEEPTTERPVRWPPDPVPVGMVAELTYRCPLHCPYCSNPVNSGDYADELDTAGWCDALGQARRLGVLQVHLSGGEPMLRRDLARIVGHANHLGMYTNLVTSGIPLDAGRLAALVAAGLDHVQLSLQDERANLGDAIAGLAVHDRKLEVARLVVDSGLPLTINVVLHRYNVDRLLEIAELAVRLGADRLELAHTQYYGWGLRNKAALLPTPKQIEQAEHAAAQAQRRFGDQIQLVYVVADYHRARPKACMAGWGSRQFVVAPTGDVLPCLAAGQLPGLGVSNLRGEPLADIWYASPAFNRFRGTDWMRQPCRSCPLREEDLGGCRCQAYQLTGDAAATDPVCELSPHHRLVTTALAGARRVAPAPLEPRRVN